jgi:hypothetical protein
MEIEILKQHNGGARLKELGLSQNGTVLELKGQLLKETL